MIKILKALKNENFSLLFPLFDLLHYFHYFMNVWLTVDDEAIENALGCNTGSKSMR